MYRKIIIGYDGGESSEDALALGRAIGDATGAGVVVTGVFPDGMFVDREQEEQLARRVEAAAERIGAEAEAFASGSPAHGLHDAAEELEADLVVVGQAGGSGQGRLPAGNVGARLMHGAPCAVAVAAKGLRDAGAGLRAIGVALDGSDESGQALEAAIELGHKTGATLRLISAATPSASSFGWGYGVWSLEEDLREEFRQVLDAAVARVPDDLPTATKLLNGEPVPVLVEECGKGLDLLFVGSRGYGPLQRVLLGSVSAELVRRAPCSVLAVPRGVESSGSPAAGAGHSAAHGGR